VLDLRLLARDFLIVLAIVAGLIILAVVIGPVFTFGS